MQLKPELTRELLYHRHRLSHRQIDDWIGKEGNNSDLDATLYQMAKVAYFVEVTDCFNESGIPFISFKGPLLSQKIYNDPIYRYSNDFDFLIDRENVTKALNILYHRSFRNVHFELPDDECRKQFWFDNINHLMLHNSEIGVTIEIHWNLFSTDFISKKALQKIINSNTVKFKFSGREFNVFSHEFELIYLIIHGGVHFWGRLKWLVDIKELLNLFPLDEKYFSQLTNDMRANRLVALCNSVLAIYFPDTKKLPSKEKVSDGILKYALNTIQKDDLYDLNSESKYIGYYWNISKLFPGLRYKLSVAKKIMFASDLAEKDWMPCSSFLHYLVSPFWKMIRGTRNSK